MELTLLIQSAMGLLIILGFLVFILVLAPKPKKKEVPKSKKVVQEQKTKSRRDLEFVRTVVKNRESTIEELQEALALVVKYHGAIPKKLGLRSHPESQIYMDILFNICRHPNTNKDIIVVFDRELGRLNPDYKKDLHDAMMRGLNSRGI
ncbi:MAG: hypothetical protein ABFQ64_02280 [Campylobacterota bacterium]